MRPVKVWNGYAKLVTGIILFSLANMSRDLIMGDSFWMFDLGGSLVLGMLLDWVVRTRRFVRDEQLKGNHEYDHLLTNYDRKDRD